MATQRPAKPFTPVRFRSSPLNPFDALVALVLGGMGVALATILALDEGTVVEVLLVLVLFAAVTLRWVLHALGWRGLWRR